MALLHPASFASAVLSSKESLEKVAVIISKYFGESKADSFRNACGNFDFKTANSILDETMRELTGHNSVSIALSVYASKFPQLPDLENKVSSALSEAEKVKVINGYTKEIIKIIDGEG